MKKNTKNNLNYLSSIKELELTKNPIVKATLYIGAALIVFYIGGKVMKILSVTVSEYKGLRNAFNT